MFDTDPFENINFTELLSNKAFLFLHNAICRNFSEQSMKYYFDKRNKELFSTGIFLEMIIRGKMDVGAETNLSQEEMSSYSERIRRIDENDDIIEIPRISQGEWDTIMETVILQNESSQYKRQLEDNLNDIRGKQYWVKSFILAFTKGVDDRKVEEDFDKLLNNIVSNRIYNWVRSIDENEDRDVMEILNSLNVDEYDVVIRKARVENEEEPVENERKPKQFNKSNKKIPYWLIIIAIALITAILSGLANYSNG